MLQDRYIGELNELFAKVDERRMVRTLIFPFLTPDFLTPQI